MATQFSLSYDGEGNPSLVENKVESKAVAPTGTFNIDPFERVRTVRTDYTFESVDPFDYDNQLIYLQQYINDNDADVTTDNKGPDILAKDKLTAAQRQTVENLKKAGLLEEAETFEKTAKGIKTAETFKKISTGATLFGITNPFISLGSAFASGYTKYAEKKQSDIIDNYFQSDYFQAMYKAMDYEYAAYQDYDAYNDITDIGPTYTRDDVKVGTYFDAEDHGEPPSNNNNFDYEGDAYGTTPSSNYSSSGPSYSGMSSIGSGGGGGGADSGANSAASGSGSTDTCGSF